MTSNSPTPAKHSDSGIQIEMNNVAKFWSRVNKTDGCWEWTKGKFTTGYGQAWLGTKHAGAHRIAWELTYGQIPKGLFVCHHCDNPICVRPEHLFLGTPKDNAVDMKKKGRQLDQRGDKNHGRKLSSIIVAKIRERFESGLTRKQLCQEFGLGPRHCDMIVTRKIWNETSISAK